MVKAKQKVAGSRSSQVMPRVPQEAPHQQKLQWSLRCCTLAGMGSSAIAKMVPESAAALHQTQQKWHEGDGLCFKQMKHLPLLPHHLPVSSCLILVDLTLPTGLKHGAQLCSQHKWRWLELMGCFIQHF